MRPSVETPDFCAVEWSTNLNTFSARYFLCISCLFHFLICLKQNCRFSSVFYFLAFSVSIEMLINIYCSSTFIHASLSKPVSNSIFYLLKKRCIFVRREFSFIFWKLISPFFSHNAAAFSFNAWLHPPTRNLLFLSQHFLNFPWFFTFFVSIFSQFSKKFYNAYFHFFHLRQWLSWHASMFT